MCPPCMCWSWRPETVVIGVTNSLGCLSHLCGLQITYKMIIIEMILLIYEKMYLSLFDTFKILLSPLK